VERSSGPPPPQHDLNFFRRWPSRYSQGSSLPPFPNNISLPPPFFARWAFPLSLFGRPPCKRSRAFFLFSMTRKPLRIASKGLPFTIEISPFLFSFSFWGFPRILCLTLYCTLLVFHRLLLFLVPFFLERLVGRNGACGTSTHSRRFHLPLNRGDRVFSNPSVRHRRPPPPNSWLGTNLRAFLSSERHRRRGPSLRKGASAQACLRFWPSVLNRGDRAPFPVCPREIRATFLTGAEF